MRQKRPASVLLKPSAFEEEPTRRDRMFRALTTNWCVIKTGTWSLLEALWSGTSRAVAGLDSFAASLTLENRTKARIKRLNAKAERERAKRQVLEDLWTAQKNLDKEQAAIKELKDKVRGGRGFAGRSKRKEGDGAGFAA